MNHKELLKEVTSKDVLGEPVLYAEFAEDGGWLGDASEYADHLEEPHALFTSDQVAAAVLKATKPLEDEVDMLRKELRRANCELTGECPGCGPELGSCVCAKVPLL